MIRERQRTILGTDFPSPYQAELRGFLFLGFSRGQRYDVVVAVVVLVSIVDGEVSGVVAGSMMTVRVEVAERPALSVTT